MKLFTYWRSQAAFRVRVAMRLKGLRWTRSRSTCSQAISSKPAYHALNPEGVVPALIDGEGPPLVQSLAILEYLDEKYPEPPLLPKDLRGAGACAGHRPDGGDGRASVHRAARAQVSRGGIASR